MTEPVHVALIHAGFSMTLFTVDVSELCYKDGGGAYYIEYKGKTYISCGWTTIEGVSRKLYVEE